jgi:hypothetical protein
MTSQVLHTPLPDSINHSTKLGGDGDLNGRRQVTNITYKHHKMAFVCWYCIDRHKAAQVTNRPVCSKSSGVTAATDEASAILKSGSVFFPRFLSKIKRTGTEDVFTNRTRKVRNAYFSIIIGICRSNNALKWGIFH